MTFAPAASVPPSKSAAQPRSGPPAVRPGARSARAAWPSELTQVELARRLGVTQAAISRIEQPHDLLLSTLNAYLGAIGGRASVVVTFADGHEAVLVLQQHFVI